MRRWLLVLMVLLLPLRGWVGEAMAGQMLQERMAQAQAADHAMPHGHHGNIDGHAHAMALEHHEAAASADTGTAHDDCGTCAACQACSSVALSPSLPAIAAGGFSQPRPETVQRPYASAEPLLAFKPPRG